MIDHLISGGVIVNYFCSSQCRHCLYNCSPRRSKNYMDRRTASICFELLAARGVRSVHIGGGEPLLRPDLLGHVLDEARQADVAIEYVETNASWYRDEPSACHVLEKLKRKGVTTLLISISPFHVEYTPFSKTLGVMDACRKCGIRIFPWMETFFNDLSSLDPKTPHGFEHLKDRFGPSFLADIKNRYWIHLGGRALKTFHPLYEAKPIQKLLSEHPLSCEAELKDTTHFHVDLYQNYIPGLCSGLAINIKDLGQPLSSKKYPLIHQLLEKGISGLYEKAKAMGFYPTRKGYISKCDLCTDIRQYFSSKNLFDIELQPKGFYTG